MNPDETRDLYQSIYDGLTRDQNPDYSLAQTLGELSETRTFSPETLELLCKTANSELSPKQNTYLRTCLKSRNDEKTRRICRYISLGATGVPKVSFITVTHVSSIAESSLCDHLASSPESRIGIAHALLTLRYSPPASGGSSTERHIERYPDIIRLFGEHHDRVIDIHEFIEERNLKMESDDDFAQIRDFLELEAPSLSSGLL